MTDISHLSGALQEEKAKARVLLVDDQKIIAEAMKRLLADQPDISLYYCPNPSKAIDAAKEVKPTVILQDLIMPEVDGLTRHARHSPRRSILEGGARRKIPRI